MGTRTDLSQEDALHLQLGDNLIHEEELAAVNIISIGLKFIWEARVAKKQITIHQLRSEIEANIALLRKSKYSGVGQKMHELLNN